MGSRAGGRRRAAILARALARRGGREPSTASWSSARALSAFIVTLATASVFTGLNLGHHVGEAVLLSARRFQGDRQLDGLSAWPALLLVMLAIRRPRCGSVFSRVGIGRQILAIGANPRAGRARRRNRSDVAASSCTRWRDFSLRFAGIILTRAALAWRSRASANDWLPLLVCRPDHRRGRFFPADISPSRA